MKAIFAFLGTVTLFVTYPLWIGYVLWLVLLIVLLSAFPLFVWTVCGIPSITLGDAAREAWRKLRH